jgi:methionyl-tRNA formyltransferase
MSEPRVICIAGKNDIAVRCLKWLFENGWPAEKMLVVCNRDDPGKHTWQSSLEVTAKKFGVRQILLEAAEREPNCLFLSLEFDRIIKPQRFLSERLFNLHFSKLPEYRGVHTSIWPILDGRTDSGVTLHRIDSGIDTGSIVAQQTFVLPVEWTSRDLYENYLDHGTELMIRNLPDLIKDTTSCEPQPIIGATYHGRFEIDFRNLPQIPKGTAFQVHNHLRAFSFWEFQLPTVEGDEVISSKIMSEPSCQKPGSLYRESKWTAKMSTMDYDVAILFNVYAPLFEWARYGGCSPDSNCLDLIVDLNRLNRNGWSALMMAAWHGQIAVAEKLIELGADPSFPNRRGTTPLMYAASYAEKSGDDRLMRVLVKAGACRDASDSQGMTVMEHLRLRGSDQLVRMLENINHVPFI